MNYVDDLWESVGIPPISDSILRYVIAYPEERGLPIDEIIRRRKNEHRKCTSTRRIYRGIIQMADNISYPGRIYPQKLFKDAINE